MHRLGTVAEEARLHLTTSSKNAVLCPSSFEHSVGFSHAPALCCLLIRGVGVGQKGTPAETGTSLHSEAEGGEAKEEWKLWRRVAETWLAGWFSDEHSLARLRSLEWACWGPPTETWSRGRPVFCICVPSQPLVTMQTL